MITVKHALNDQQSNDNSRTKKNLETVVAKKAELEYEEARKEHKLNLLGENLEVNVMRTMFNVYKTALTNVEDVLEKAKNAWIIQDLSGTQQSLLLLETLFAEAQRSASELDGKINDTLTIHNLAVRQTNQVIVQYKNLSGANFMDSNFTLQVSQISKSIQESIDLAKKTNALSKKLDAMRNAQEQIRNLNVLFISKQNEELQNVVLENSLLQDTYCKLDPTCNFDFEKPLDMTSACEQKEKLSNFFASLTGNLSNKSSVNTALQKIELEILETYLEKARSQNDTIFENEVLKIYVPINMSGNISENNSEILSHFIATRNISLCELHTLNFGVDTLEEIQLGQYSGLKPASEIIPEQKKLCCLENQCVPCCDNECKNETIPVIILHGHALSEDTYADFSLNSLSEISELLSENGYLDLGIISEYPQTSNLGIWTGLKKPIVLRASYYLDAFLMPEDLGFSLVQRKTENVDTYAIKLGEIIDDVIRRTGREKVDIIAHSMGGLVTRRYMQIFSDSKIRKAIFMGTPNRGVEGRVADLCDLTGSELECRDLAKGSLLLNKLNRDNSSNNKIINIIGKGCEMKEGDGDGIVLAINSELEGARNNFVNGDCKGKLLHQKLLSVETNPSFGKALLEALN